MRLSTPSSRKAAEVAAVDEATLRRRYHISGHRGHRSVHGTADDVEGSVPKPKDANFGRATEATDVLIAI
eukprot:1686558-Pyramimonas_sp.AAC.1